ncbi:MAG: bacteriohemerythrin [Sulfurimicrobium sp.]|nr:bacteriohemerythrin [Sulfurimicrobium sp.]MDP1705522.1 bacteriohemerythrin [Sulfurimicrobium sp.]MDP1897444.1 bacteriohemerythrin [Sulfurimicrobium sp.]MDP2197475.1 bacteriohemerythrin [Sulfurimicrobium sp.]MDP2963318.1 bacteriohemerythrin [Sulfurimicrobium sp.]
MNELLEWNDSLNIGIDEIDNQHKALVVLLNQLHVAIHEKQGTAACIEILDKLVEYTRVHFTVEESLMRILGYPDYAAHLEGHEMLIAQVVELQQKLKSGKANVSFELLHFLRGWLTHHIMETDKAYVPHFIAKGVEQKSSRKSFWKFW